MGMSAQSPDYLEAEGIRNGYRLGWQRYWDCLNFGYRRFYWPAKNRRSPTGMGESYIRVIGQSLKFGVSGFFSLVDAGNQL